MENLLRTDFISHYTLPITSVTNISESISEPYFEVEDTATREVVLHTTRGNGMAVVSNPSKSTLIVINYDKFMTSLPHAFQNGRKRCDIIITSESDRCVILGELKDRGVSTSKKRTSIRKGAKEQLFQSLNTLVEVNSIKNYFNAKTIKKCCYFNKQSHNPTATINAVTAFNRLSNTFPAGFKRQHAGIEAKGFEFWEYTGQQTLAV
jgi:hypothetical protein